MLKDQQAQLSLGEVQAAEGSFKQPIAAEGSGLLWKSSLRISAFLCVSAVK
jgi:hypothetical protein